MSIISGSVSLINPQFSGSVSHTVIQRSAAHQITSLECLRSDVNMVIESYTAEPAYSYIVYSRFWAIVELNLVPFSFVSSTIPSLLW